MFEQNCNVIDSIENKLCAKLFINMSNYHCIRRNGNIVLEIAILTI